MMMSKCFIRSATGLFLLGLFLLPGALKGEAVLKDGIYEGEHSFVAVAVTVAGGRITEIRMTRHGGGGEKYAEMVRPLLVKMVEEQSTEVDGVSGATTSGNHLKKAVEKALRKAETDD